MSRANRSVGVGAMAILLLGAAAWAGAQAPGPQSPSSDESKASGVPQTAEEHFARAAAYREKAASYRQEAETHRKMFADFDKKQGNPALQSKAGHELPWIAKMRKHCEAYMKQAESLAAEADRLAEFHRMRGEEMKGK